MTKSAGSCRFSSFFCGELNGAAPPPCATKVQGVSIKGAMCGRATHRQHYEHAWLNHNARCSITSTLIERSIQKALALRGSGRSSTQTSGPRLRGAEARGPASSQ